MMELSEADIHALTDGGDLDLTVLSEMYHNGILRLVMTFPNVGNVKYLKALAFFAQQHEGKPIRQRKIDHRLLEVARLYLEAKRENCELRKRNVNSAAATRS